MGDTITLTKAERMELERRVMSRTGRAEDARRARAILLLADGHTWDEACDRVPCSRGYLASWSKRFEEQRIAGLYSRNLGQVLHSPVQPGTPNGEVEVRRSKSTSQYTISWYRPLARSRGRTHHRMPRLSYLRMTTRAGLPRQSAVSGTSR